MVFPKVFFGDGDISLKLIIRNIGQYDVREKGVD